MSDPRERLERMTLDKEWDYCDRLWLWHICEAAIEAHESGALNMRREGLEFLGNDYKKRQMVAAHDLKVLMAAIEDRDA